MDSNNDEQALVQAAAAGDADAFSRLAEQYYTQVYRFAWKYCGVREDAEDIAQETFIRAAQAIGSFRGDAAFGSWLCRIALNAAKDRFRQRKRRAETALDPEWQGLEEAAQEEQVMAGEAYRAVASLPDKLRDAVMLVCGEGMSHAEAAAVLECKESTVSWRVHEARKKLEKVLRR